MRLHKIAIFDEISSKIAILCKRILLEKLQNNRSQRHLVLRSRRIVHLKAHETYLYKSEISFILPQILLVQATFEEGSKSWKIKNYSIRKIDPSSMIAETKRN